MNKQEAIARLESIIETARELKTELMGLDEDLFDELGIDWNIGNIDNEMDDMLTSISNL